MSGTHIVFRATALKPRCATQTRLQLWNGLSCMRSAVSITSARSDARGTEKRCNRPVDANAAITRRCVSPSSSG